MLKMFSMFCLIKTCQIVDQKKSLIFMIYFCLTSFCNKMSISGTSKRFVTSPLSSLGTSPDDGVAFYKRSRPKF